MEKKTVYTPRLKKVLKSYQAAATTSLNGPNCYPDNWKASNGHSEKRDRERQLPAKQSKPCPPPIIVPPDTGCERSETVLEGEVISCFLVGGERRLCLPQILNTVLRDFSLQQINSVCDELQIFCSRCTVEQLEMLKVTGILPASAPSCGLITKTDAERLCADLLYSNPPKENLKTDKKCFSLRVYHECFGKSTGIYFPSLYTSANDKCIMCCECEGMFTPQKFVCHSHKSKENRTCHWGFDSNNWRSYLMLAKDHNQNNEELQEHLNDMKSRFDFATKYNKKRKILSEKQEERESNEVPTSEVSDTIKKIKTEDVSSNSPPAGPFAGYPYLFPSLPSWCTDSSMMMYWYPAFAAANASDSSALAARFSAFKPWIPGVKMKYRELSLTSHGSILPQHLATKFAEPPVLQNPEKIVPLSESSRFESHYQPNVALAPATCKSKDSIDEKTRAAVIRKSNNQGTKESTVSLNNDNCEDDYFSCSTEDTLSENSGLSDEEQGSIKAQKKLFSELAKILNQHQVEKSLKLKIFTEVENIIKKVRTEAMSEQQQQRTEPIPDSSPEIRSEQKKAAAPVEAANKA
ncbi:Cs ski like protein-like protein [Dinothrombium tinctorium]|uniref:Cs ski like protein-like protein n=1 Tax=Dinothrombium tinctorium TaxID=1965070 RepID=A0A3S3PDF2_9ACAR|nr:Cs ski like protein-like protein [Dinothrombium tinctorium]